MENASKALLMAAGVLIAVLILSLAVYLFMSFGSESAEFHKQMENDRLNQFNSQFTTYEGKEGITIYDVMTAVNLARDNNSYYDLTTASNSNYYVTVNFIKPGISGSNMEKKTDDQLQEILKQENLNSEVEDDGETAQRLPEYTCSTQLNPVTGRVNVVTFSPK